MMETLQVSVTAKDWDSQASRLVQRLGPEICADSLKRQVDEKRITLYEVSEGEGEGSTPLGIFFLRVDTLITGERQLVVMHGISEPKNATPITSVLGPFFDQIAQDNDIKSIRIHSDRRGLDRILEQSGYNFMESVYVRRLYPPRSAPDTSASESQAGSGAKYCVWNKAAGRPAPAGSGLALEEALEKVGKDNPIYEVRRESNAKVE